MLNPAQLQTQSGSLFTLLDDPIIATPETTMMEAIAQMNGGGAVGLSSDRRLLAETDIQPQSSIERSPAAEKGSPLTSCVAIVSDGRLVGILTRQDVLRSISTGQDLDKLAIAEVMTSHLITLPAATFTDSIVAIDLLQQHHIRHLPIVDDRHYLVGIVTYERLQQHQNAALTAVVREMAIQVEATTTAAHSIHSLNTELQSRVEWQTLLLQDRDDRLQDFCDYVNEVLIDLEESRQFLQTVIETFPLAVFWKDRESRYLGCNYNFAQDANLSLPEQIVGKNDYDLRRSMVEADAHRADDLQTINSGEAKLGVVETLTRADGTSIWVETNKIPLKNLKGETIGILGTYQDITDRKQSEAIIAKQAEQEFLLREITQRIRKSLNLSTIFETAVGEIRQFLATDRVGIFKFDGDCNFDRGKFIAESIGVGFESILDSEIHNLGLSKKLVSCYQQGNVNVVEDIYTADLLDGEVQVLAKLQIQASLVMPLLNGSKLWGLLCIHHCCSQRTWQENEINFIKQIAEQIGIAIHQASLFELLQAELIERQRTELQLRDRNEELAISSQEITRATRLKDEFLANMSHELRTPLNAILGMSEAMQDTAFGPINERQLKSLRSIEKSGKHLLALINDILDLSKIEANKFDLELTNVSIQSLCQNSVLFIKELAHKRQIRLQTQLPEYLKDLQLQVDDRRCRQVLINLLSNAVKFTPEGGNVILKVHLLESSAQIQSQIAFSVVDTGIGIAPENIGKLFQSFVQIDSSLNRQYAGTGLGLALVKRIVELHGGNVSVESQLNQGSCFTVFLPFIPSVPIVISPSLPPLDGYSCDPETTPTIDSKALILVVEDNDANMETMTGYLKIRGYHPIEADNGQQAIKMTQIHHPDIILMDIQMPGMDGFEATRQIRQIPECATIPIVALTALAMPLDRQKCLDAGADQYVTKPVKLAQLVSTIENILQRN